MDCKSLLVLVLVVAISLRQCAAAPPTLCFEVLPPGGVSLLALLLGVLALRPLVLGLGRFRRSDSIPSNPAPSLLHLLRGGRRQIELAEWLRGLVQSAKEVLAYPKGALDVLVNRMVAIESLAHFGEQSLDRAQMLSPEAQPFADRATKALDKFAAA